MSGISSIRFIGMQSGIDVDGIVSAMMEAEQIKVDTIRQKKTALEWKGDALKNINSLVSGFVDRYFSLASPDNISSGSSFNTKKTTMPPGSAVSVTASALAQAGAYTVNSITSLASGAKVQSSRGICADANNKISLTSQLKDLNLSTPLEFAQDTDGEGNTVNHLRFQINGVDFEFSDTDTLQSVMNKVNKSSAGVTMSYSSISDKITVQSKTLGSDSQIIIANTAGNFFAESESNSALGLAFGTIENGTDAVVYINGYEVVQKSNTFTMDGITFHLQNTTNQEIDFSVSQDIDSIYNKINGFIEGYNELIAALNSKISEEKYRSYTPLTDAQRKGMSDKEVELWEEKAKSGLLKNDAQIRKILTDIRNAFIQTVEGAGISFAGMGISSTNWADRGKLYINEAKLKDALANSIDEVEYLFTNVSASEDAKMKYSQNGLVQRIRNSLNEYVNTVKTEVLGRTTKQISDFDNKIADALRKLNEKENYFYSKYAALETALSELYAQGSYFSSLLGGY